MIYIIRLIVAFVLLSLASYQDIKTRYVSDKIWVLMMVVGLSLFVYDVMTEHIGILESFFALMLIIMAYTIFIVFNRWQKGAFGGADAKAFICISILLPVPFVLGMFPFSYVVVVMAELVAFAWYFPKALKVPRREWKNINFPLIPFLLVGLIFATIAVFVQGSIM